MSNPLPFPRGLLYYFHYTQPILLSQVMLCACLGLGARTLVPTAEAWIPAAPLLHGRGTSASVSASLDTTRTRGGGAISYRPVLSAKGRWEQHQGVGTTFAVASGGGGWGVPAATSATAFSSRESGWRGRPVANCNTLAVGGAERRGRVGVTMSMAEEERGGYNAVLGALAIAGLGAVYYG